MAVSGAPPLRLDVSGAGACTAPPHPATMTRFPSSSTTASPSPGSRSRWFQRTNALLIADGDDAPPCSQSDCLPAQAASLLSFAPQVASQNLRVITCSERLLRMATWESQRLVRLSRFLYFSRV